MSRIHMRLRRFRSAREGATIVEFALVLAPFLVLVLGLLDLGFRTYVNVMLQGALNEAARQETIGGVDQSALTAFVQGRMSTIVPQGTSGGTPVGTVTITPSSYYNYTGIGTMEPLTKDANNNNLLDIGDCFTDYNGDNVRDTNSGGTGLGGSDDIVYYTATITFPSFVPMALLLGHDQLTETVSATTMFKNQPYASQPTPATVCRTS
ncbi:MAG TPA: TadE/TadG family type IV pilus assembly protein [Sphingomonas sp.]